MPSDNIVAMYVPPQILLGLALGPKSPLNFQRWPIRLTSTSGAMAATRHGMTFAASSFCPEAGTAGAVAVIGALFSWLGYAPNAVQSAESQAGIVWLMSVIPAIFTLLGGDHDLLHPRQPHHGTHPVRSGRAQGRHNFCLRTPCALLGPIDGGERYELTSPTALLWLAASWEPPH